MLERREKQNMVKTAALACFASRSQLVWQRWRLYISRQKMMHLGLQRHQVEPLLWIGCMELVPFRESALTLISS